MYGKPNFNLDESYNFQIQTLEMEEIMGCLVSEKFNSPSKCSITEKIKFLGIRLEKPIF